MRQSLLTLLTAATLSASASVLAQEAGNVGHGSQIAYTICIACHAVAKDQQVSPNSEAPPFPTIAATPGMTSIALTAALLTSHRRTKAGQAPRRDCLYSRPQMSLVGEIVALRHCPRRLGARDLVPVTPQRNRDLLCLDVRIAEAAVIHVGKAPGGP